MKTVEFAIRLAVLVVFGIPASVVDLRRRIIPDGLVAAVAVCAAAAAMNGQGPTAVRIGVGIAAAIAGAAITWAARLLTGGGLGWGDVKLAAALGLLLGWPGVLTALGAASLLALSAAGAFRLRGSEAAVPFGPFLCGGALVQLVGDILG